MVNYPSNFEITEPDIYYDMPASIYHSDPCPTPSLSNSLIRDLLDKSPKHAAWKHPKLNPNAGITPSISMNRGTLLHNLILGCGGEIAVIHADDFKKKIAQNERDKALYEGKTPVLVKDYDQINRCADIAVEKIAQHPACKGFFNQGHAETVIAWQEENIWCRSMIDRLPDDPTYPIFDLKGTDVSAAPTAWEKRLRDVYRTQGVFYNRGLSKIEKKHRPSMCFIVIEMFEPFEINVFSLSDALEEFAQDEVERAIQIWKHSISYKKWQEWDGYPQGVSMAELKPWMTDKAIDQVTIEEAWGMT